jgi:pSer/pThr/pTyr-binding forkhead associated (FHA) protein
MPEQLLGELEPLGGGDAIPLLKPRLVIGRRSSCDIVLEFPNVSQQHCELQLENGYWIIRDLGSRNGIKVNGDRVESKWLQPGDEVSIAKHRYEIRYTPSGDAPPPEDIEEGQNPFGRSLLEKAGLARPERRPERSPSKPPRPNPNLPQTFDKDEDDAVRFLLDE